VKAKRPARAAKTPALRQQAEELLRTTRRDVAAMPTKDVQWLVYELQVHQLELEMQNDELRRTQAELQAARDRYADLYDFSPVGHLMLDWQGNILEANSTAGTLLGFSRDKLRGQSFERFIAREDQDSFAHHVRDVLEGGAPHFCEVRLHSESGVSCWLLLKSLAMRDKSGRITNWRMALLEISERKRAEEDLKNASAELALANERWGLVMRATNDGVWDWDVLHDRVSFSLRWKAMHGFDEQDSLESSKVWSERIHPEDRARVMEKLDAYWKQQRPEFWEEYRMQRKDGTWMWVLDRGVAVWDEQGQVVRMAGAEMDITWRKEAEEALRRREREFRTLADNVPACFGYVDRDQCYRFVNKQYEKLLQRPADQILGLTMQELLSPESYAMVQPHLEASLDGQQISFEYESPVPGVGERWFSAHYVPDRNEEGHVTGLFILLGDVTQLKQSEAVVRKKEGLLQDLSARLLQAQEEERRRIAQDLHDDFTQRLISLAIDLRMVQEDVQGVAPSSGSQLQHLGDSAERLATDLQHVSHHLHPWILEHLGLEAAVREQVDEFAARTGLKTELIVRDPPHAISGAQALCLYRVLQEGLNNVQKHAGATNVLVRFLGTGKGVGLCVHDDGRGIESLECAAPRKGLGLISMEERVRALQGTFRVRTRVGDGTEIHIWLPLEDVTGES